VFDLKPDAYLWQAGIVKFYLDDIDGAGKIFARAAETYERRFGSPATEERIWRDACELKYLDTVAKSRRKDLKDENNRISALIPTIKEMESSDNLFGLESRKVFRLARDLFSSTVSVDKSGELLARAKLRSIAGSDKSLKLDPKMWKLHSWYFLGLHYDCIGNVDESKRCMKMALKLNPSSGKSEDIVHTLPLLHMSARDWFDDDEFDAEIMFEEETSPENESFMSSPGSLALSGMAYADPLIEKSIKEGVTKMKNRELKDALRLRGKITTGSKEELQERLFCSLMDDAGFASGFAP
jgi:tetratricopeptide (TPR) repeat protein